MPNFSVIASVLPDMSTFLPEGGSWSKFVSEQTKR